MKTLVTTIVRQRNPAFAFGDKVDHRMIVSFVLQTLIGLLRGLMVMCYGKIPKGLILGKSVKWTYTHKIRFGKFLKLGDFVHLQALGEGGIIIGDNVSIGANSHLVVSTSLHHLGAHIKLGNQVGIGEFAYLGGGGGLEIGDDCIIGQYFSCHPENHRFNDTDQKIRLQGVSRKGISVEENCWIGAKVTLLNGVHIGANSVIAAGAVVTQSFPPNSVIAGVPARIIKNR